mgnify:FL=1
MENSHYNHVGYCKPWLKNHFQYHHIFEIQRNSAAFWISHWPHHLRIDRVLYSLILVNWECKSCTYLPFLTHSEWDPSNCPPQCVTSAWDFCPIVRIFLPLLHQLNMCHHWAKIALIWIFIALFANITQLPSFQDGRSGLAGDTLLGNWFLVEWSPLLWDS